MILSGKEILKRKDKDIIINPFDENKINPNSYCLLYTSPSPRD